MTAEFPLSQYAFRRERFYAEHNNAVGSVPFNACRRAIAETLIL